jgi:cytochrome c553
VSGQHAEYAEAQLKAFRDGTRENDPNRIMRAIALKMTDAEIKAVTDYMAGLH